MSKRLGRGMAGAVCLGAALLASPLLLGGCQEKVEARCQTRADCADGAACVAGTCQGCPTPCAADERCLEAVCLPVACGDRPCRAAEACVDGTCRAADCVAVSCPSGQSCAQGSCYPVECGEQSCSEGDVCVDGGCTEPSCVNRDCAEGEVCAAGACLPSSCAGVVCAEGNACQDGRCISTRCVGVTCEAGTVCADGRCLSTACAAVACAADQACVDGACQSAACLGVVCPSGSHCSSGACLGCGPETACGDGQDEDCDGKTDCADEGCDGQACSAVAGQVCLSGTCTCPAGTKLCGSQCLDETACCLDPDSAAVTPAVAFTSPAADSYVNAASAPAFVVGGTCSAHTQEVVLTGSASATTVCSACTWTAMLDLSTVADGPVTLEVNHRDAAGNAAPPDTRTFLKDATPPALASLTIETASPTSSAVLALAYGALTGTFSEYCLLENDTDLAGCTGAWVAQSTLPDSVTVSSVEGPKALTLWLRDAAGNLSAPVTSNSVQLDLSAPTVTLVSDFAGQAFVGGTVLTLTGSASGADLAANPISIESSEDSGLTWTTQAAGLANDGSWSWTTPAISSATVRVRLAAIDLAGNVGTSESSSDFTVDSTAPELLAGQMQVNGGASPSLTNYVPVAFAAADPTTLITHYCLKYGVPTAPAAGDSCWIAVAPTHALTADVDFRLGFAAGSYSVYAWARNELGLVSSLSAAGSGTLGQDEATVTFSPVPAPALSGVTASSLDASVDTTIAAGSDVFIKWKASTTGTLAANPISIFYTTDDVTYTAVAAALPNAQGALCSLGSGETGCYRWVGASPTSAYYRIRVGALDANGRQSFRSSQPLNVASTLRVLAGETDPGTGGSAEAAIFVAANTTTRHTDPQDFIVSTSGVVYFNDTVRGLLEIDPADGVQRLLVPRTGVTGLDGAVPGVATANKPYRLSFDSQGRVLIFDYDRIRRYDPEAGTLETIIGGGTSSAATVAPRSLQFETGYSYEGSVLLVGTPDGKIYFQAENYERKRIGDGFNLRVYDPATDLVTSMSFSGSGDSFSATQDISLCMGYSIGLTFDPLTGALTRLLLGVAHWLPGCADDGEYYSIVDPATLQPVGPHPEGYDYSAGYSVGADGQFYSFSRLQNVVQKFDPATQTFATVLGDGKNGTCADGTLATSCSIDVSNVFADAHGQVYFLERGRLRTIDQGNQVRTLMGSGFSAGDGAEATSARLGAINDVKLWNDGATAKIVLTDNSEFRIRELAIGGAIATVAGNGMAGIADTTAAAATQPLSYNANGMIDLLTIQVDPSAGTIYSSARISSSLSKIDRTTGRWVDLVGGGSTPYYSGAANGLPGSQIGFTGYAALLAAFDGTNLMVQKGRYTNQFTDSFLKLYAVADGRQTALAGVAGASGGVYSADGTPGTACTVPSTGGAIQSAAWDATGARWVFNASTSDARAIRVLAAGGNIGTLATLPLEPTSFAYRHDFSNDVVYYCSGGQLYRYDVSSSANAALPWPIARMKCSGSAMVYSASRASLVFPFQQDGMGGVAEYLSP